MKDDVRFYPDDSINEDDWFYNKENIDTYLNKVGYIQTKDDIQLDFIITNTMKN